MGRRQKGKDGKRKRSWHRGGVESRKWKRSEDGWPLDGVEGDPTLGVPVPLRRNHSNRPKKT